LGRSIRLSSGALSGRLSLGSAVQKGLEPLRKTTCMMCRRAASRYYGRWGEEGLCRECVEGMPAGIRRKVLRDLYPTDRRRWRIDGLDSQPASHSGGETPESPRGPKVEEQTPAAESPHLEGATPAPHVPEPHIRSERRRHKRARAELEVSFPVPSPEAGAASGKPLHSVTKDVSLGGARIVVLDSRLLDLPLGCRLHLELTVPAPRAVIRCTAEVRNLVLHSHEAERGYLCVAFETLHETDRKILARFLASRRRD